MVINNVSKTNKDYANKCECKYSVNAFYLPYIFFFYVNNNEI